MYGSMHACSVTFSSHASHLFTDSWNDLCCIYWVDKDTRMTTSNQAIFFSLYYNKRLCRLSQPSQHQWHVLFKPTRRHAHRGNADRKLESIFIEIVDLTVYHISFQYIPGSPQFSLVSNHPCCLRGETERNQTFNTDMCIIICPFCNTVASSEMTKGQCRMFGTHHTYKACWFSTCQCGWESTPGPALCPCCCRS